MILDIVVIDLQGLRNLTYLTTGTPKYNTRRYPPKVRR